ncbi:unnamed protein product [marine sediment metagenome]|uniref:Uncharacterized protein n=1 Tax=marine sediment metagenome TaxID=412755 RepID=X0S225_9ZZZZ
MAGDIPDFGGGAAVTQELTVGLDVALFLVAASDAPGNYTGLLTIGIWN